ncbi:chitin synthase 6 [Powellomyces hirtus]|nr:chitin synthase 6 [Powellomyces hirtus]
MAEGNLTQTRARATSLVSKSNRVGIEMPPSAHQPISVIDEHDPKKNDDGPGDEETGGGGGGGGKRKKTNKITPTKQPGQKPKRKLTAARRGWVCFTWFTTWWIPSFCLSKIGRMKTKDIQMAWREKVALCAIIFFLCALMIFFVQFFSILLCPNANIFNESEVKNHNVLGSSNIFVTWNGYVYDINTYIDRHPDPKTTVLALAGSDASAWFPRVDPSTGALASTSCPDTTGYYIPPSGNVNATCLKTGYTYGYCHDTVNLDRSINVYKDTTNFPIYRVGSLAYDRNAIYDHATDKSSWVLINGRFYDITEIIKPTSWMVDAFDATFVEYMRYYKGKDASIIAEKIRPMMPCMEAQFFVGVVDDRISAVACYASQYILLGCTGIMVFILVIKFLAALQLGSKRQPEHHDRFVIMQVPCYTEGEESLRKTFDSLSLLDYDDTRKLLFIVADGLVKGAGNDLSTPELVFKILGIDPNQTPAEPMEYVAIAEGSKGHNRAQVYSGLYRIHARAVPYIVVVKCGKEGETGKLGNRGKRDSQMILMKFLNKVHYQAPMTPLDLEMYHHIKNIIGVHPYLYEYVLMVDADTEVVSDSLNRLISCCIHDGKIMGICGETKIANEKQSWVTMMQVYEYYISHHMAKAFESLFGTVTCLPGCFTMYRIRTPEKKIPLLASSDIIAEYQENIVDTLHKKNLLSLGEDRFLTTLMLKYFPEYRTKFSADAKCLTIVPDSMSILLSQRRRWINSTIHNLFELLFLPQLCGCMIFSMRFIVFLDLFATLIMPATTGYLAYLIYLSIQARVAPVISLIMMGAAYGLQAIIFIIKREYQHIGWMIINILAMPVFSFWLPLYSFWHFDDFSWGNTRKIAGAEGKDSHGGDTETFDPSIVPVMKWDDYEAMMIQREQQQEGQMYPAGDAHMDNTSEYGGGGRGGSEYSYGGNGSGNASNMQPGGNRPRSLYGTDSEAGMKRRASVRSAYSSVSYQQNQHNPQQDRDRRHDNRQSFIPLSALQPGGVMAYGQHQQQNSFAYPASGYAPSGYSGSLYAQSNPGSDPGGHNDHPQPQQQHFPQHHIGNTSQHPSSSNLRQSQFFGSTQALDRLAGPTPSSVLHMNAADAWTGGAPTDEDLVQRIRFIISKSDLRTLTKRKVRDELSAFFGVDLTDRKTFISDRVEAIVVGRE